MNYGYPLSPYGYAGAYPFPTAFPGAFPAAASPYGYPYGYPFATPFAGLPATISASTFGSVPVSQVYTTPFPGVI